VTVADRLIEGELRRRINEKYPDYGDLVVRWMTDRQKALLASGRVKGACVFLFRKTDASRLHDRGGPPHRGSDGAS
jgi:hypothetical protein